MTDAFIKPIVLTKEMGDRMVYALSDENRKKVEYFNKNVRPKYKQTPTYKPKLSIKEIMESYK